MDKLAFINSEIHSYENLVNYKNDMTKYQSNIAELQKKVQMLKEIQEILVDNEKISERNRILEFENKQLRQYSIISFLQFFQSLFYPKLV